MDGIECIHSPLCQVGSGGLVLGSPIRWGVQGGSIIRRGLIFVFHMVLVEILAEIISECPIERRHDAAACSNWTPNTRVHAMVQTS